MLLATWVFWLGRKKFVHVKPGGIAFVRETFSLDGIRALSGLIPLYLFVAIFWSLYDQTASAWVEQADSMDRNWLGIQWLSSQIQAINPILVLVLIPTCTYGVYPALNAIFRLTALRKVAIGFVITVVAFAISAGIESKITGGKLVHDGKIDSTSAGLDEHELIVRLREHRVWNVKSVHWQVGDTPSPDQNITPVPLKLRVEVGSGPKGPWTERANRDLEMNLGQPTEIELPEAAQASYVRSGDWRTHRNTGRQFGSDYRLEKAPNHQSHGGGTVASGRRQLVGGSSLAGCCRRRSSTKYCLATLGVPVSDTRGDLCLDHVPGIFVYPGTEQDEIARHVAVYVIGVAGQFHYSAGEHVHSEH